MLPVPNADRHQFIHSFLPLLPSRVLFRRAEYRVERRIRIIGAHRS